MEKISEIPLKFPLQLYDEMVRIYRSGGRLFGPNGKLTLERVMEMAKHKGNQATAEKVQSERQPGDVPDRFDSELDADRSLESQARSMTQEEMDNEWTDEQAGRIADAAMNGDKAEKKTRKKPDRSNPPYYEVYSEKPDFSDKKMEQRCDTAGKALKYIFGRSVEMAKADRVMFVVRCKALTMNDLMKE